MQIRALVLLTMAVCAMTKSQGRAEDIGPLYPGCRVRLDAPGFTNGPITGKLVSTGQEVSVADGGSHKKVPLRSIVRAQVSTRHVPASAVARNVLMSAIGGYAIRYGIGKGLDEAPSKTKSAALLVGGLSAAIGVILGVTQSKDTWLEVPVTRLGTSAGALEISEERAAIARALPTELRTGSFALADRQ
jgi:hypothetical protein